MYKNKLEKIICKVIVGKSGEGVVLDAPLSGAINCRMYNSTVRCSQNWPCMAHANSRL